MYKEYEYHIKRILQVDPYFKMYDHQRISTAKTIQGVICDHNEDKNNVYAIEFDRFWFDQIGISNEEYNKVMMFLCSKIKMIFELFYSLMILRGC